MINIAQTRAKNSRQMASASAVKVTAIKEEAGKAVCESVAERTEEGKHVDKQ